MASLPPATALGTIELDRSSAVPLYRQLYESLREAILSGRLLAGTRLPPTRTLAEKLGVSRTTVVSAFDQLVTEGYLEARQGAGTFVSQSLPEDLLRVRGLSARQQPSAPPSLADDPHEALSERGATIAKLDLSRLSDPEQPRPFRPGVPALDAFPIEVWSCLAARRWRSLPPEQLTYGEAAGYRPLREAIAGYLQSARGVHCTPEQVIVVSGTQQAIVLAARVLLDAGDTVWVEDPGYPRASGTFTAAGARTVPVPVEAEGLALGAACARAPQARMAYVTPSHQYPLGITMSLTRRLELLDWATQQKAWILEDDYDSEYRYEGRPLAALQGMDEAGRVIYVGTFSKVVFPALRLGYMVVPSALVDAFLAARALDDRCPPLADQLILTDFIEEGHFERHIRRMRSLYATRQTALVEAVEKHLGACLEISSNAAGLHLVGRFPEAVDDRKASERLRQHGLIAPPLSFYATDSLDRGGLVFGYAAVGEARIRKGVARMEEVLYPLLEDAGCLPSEKHPHP